MTKKTPVQKQTARPKEPTQSKQLPPEDASDQRSWKIAQLAASLYKAEEFNAALNNGSAMALEKLKNSFTVLVKDTLI